jgi:hypothetical protein
MQTTHAPKGRQNRKSGLSKYAQKNRYRRLDKRIYVSVRLVPVLVKFADFD